VDATRKLAHCWSKQPTEVGSLDESVLVLVIWFVGRRLQNQSRAKRERSRSLRWAVPARFRSYLSSLILALALIFSVLPVSGQSTSAGRPSARDSSNDPRQLEETVSQFEKFLASAPSTTPRAVLNDVRIRLATAHLKLHRYHESLQSLQKIDPADVGEIPARVWIVRGLDYLALDRLPEATDSLRKGLVADPRSATARLALGDALARSGHLDSAEHEFAKQTQLTPSLADAWYKLGLAHAEMSREFSEKSPESVAGQLLAAEELLVKGNNLDAARAFFRLLHQAPTQAGVRAGLGTALLQLGYAKSAEHQLSQEIAIDSESPQARLALAQTAALRGDWDQVRNELEYLAGSEPHELNRLLEFPTAGIVHQGWIQGKMQPPKGFVDSGAGILWRAWLDDSEVVRASVKGKSEEDHECAKAFSKSMMEPDLWLSEVCYHALERRLTARNDLSPREKIKLAETEFRLGHYDAARATAQHVLESDPQNDWGHYWLDKVHAALSEDCFVKVAALNPDSARVHEMVAEHYANWSDYLKAKTEYLSALRLAPELPDLHLGLGSVYWRLGDWPNAEKELTRTLELTPGSTVAQYELGNTYLQQRKWGLAISQLRVVSGESATALRARLDLAKAEEEAGQTREALDDLLPLLAKDQDGEVHYRAAGLYRKLDDTARAQEMIAVFRQLRAAILRADHDELESLEKDQETQEHSNTPQLH
jgi:tetratricopeptide (TPR) repeat protein